MSALSMPELLDHARRIHPTIACDDEVFASFIAERAALGTSTEDLTARAPELFLVCAALEGNPPALHRLDELVLAKVPRTIARIEPTPELMRATFATVRQLLLDNGGAPQLAEYTGATPLVAWVRVFAIRVALDMARGSVPTSARTAFDDDEELRRLRAEYGAAVSTLVREAMASLDVRQRTSLHMHKLDRLSVEDIARLYRVHHTTVTTWIDQATRKVRASVVARLKGPVRPASMTSFWKLALSSTIVTR